MTAFRLDRTINLGAVITLTTVVISTTVVFVHTDDKLDALRADVARIETEHERIGQFLKQITTAITENEVQNARLAAIEKQLDKIEQRVQHQ